MKHPYNYPCPYMKNGSLCTLKGAKKRENGKVSCIYWKHPLKCPKYREIDTTLDIMEKDEKIVLKAYKPLWQRFWRKG